MSRHWYDLAHLCSGPVGPAAIENTTLQADVVHTKNVLYYTGYLNYEACTSGGLKLVPKTKLADALQKDFDHMVRAGMFWESPGTFESVLEQLAEAEARINTKGPA